MRAIEYERTCRILLALQCVALADELALFVGQQKRMAIRARVATRAQRMGGLYLERLHHNAAHPCRVFLRAGVWQQADMGDPCVHAHGHAGDHESGLDLVRRTADVDGPRIVVPE